MSTPTLDVLVLGAGPAGSASAALLARTGLRVLAVDRDTFPREKACSEYLSPEAVRVLERLGVARALEAAGAAPLQGTVVTASRGATLEGHFARATPAPARPTGLAVARRLLDAALVDAARQAGATVRERTTVAALLEEDGRVAGAIVREAGGGTRALRARLVIGADGLRSLAARRIGGVRRQWPRRVAFVAHVAGVPGLAASAQMHVGADGYVGLNPLGGGVANVALVTRAARARAAAGDATGFFLRELERFPGVRGRVRRDAIVREVLVTGPFGVRARRVVTDGALLVGDAADFFDPFTGEGICAALRGAELVEQVVPAALAASAGPDARALAPYAAARRRAFAGKWAVERLIGWAMEWPALFDHAVGRIGRRRGMADTLVGVTGDFVPARAVLNPWFLARMVV